MGWKLFAAAALGLMLVSTAAAATIRGSPRGELLRGTPQADRIDALGGADRVTAIGGGRDTVVCGPGRDVVTVDEIDRVARDCEVVSRRIANNPLPKIGAGQHRTQVESHSIAYGSTIVSVFQNGRFIDGAATAIGFSTSTNGGSTWRSGLLPGLTWYSPSQGESPRASDPVVAYDALHGVWLANTLIVGGEFSALFVSRSTNGLTWSGPATAARTNGRALAYDKNWIACDNGATSPYRGNCYIAYTDLGLRIAIVSSRDGGVTWSAPRTVDASRAGNAVGALPLVQPDGALTVVYVRGEFEAISSARSTDGGVSFAPSVNVAQFAFRDLRGLRAPPLPAATVDASGRLYVVWMDCSFRSSCNGNDLVLSTSMDGRGWTERTPLPRTGFDSFVPGIAAHPTQPGRIAVVTYLRTSDACTPATCRVGVAWMRSSDGGTTWTAPQRLDAEPMLWSWLADSNLGAFLGDYLGIAYTSTAAVPTFPLAAQPSGGRLNVAMFAASFPG